MGPTPRMRPVKAVRPAHAGSLVPWDRLAFAALFTVMAAFIVVVVVLSAHSRGHGGPAGSGAGQPATGGHGAGKSFVRAEILAAIRLRDPGSGAAPASSGDDQATRMIEAGDDDATTSLWRQAGGADGIAAADTACPACPAGPSACHALSPAGRGEKARRLRPG